MTNLTDGLKLSQRIDSAYLRRERDVDHSWLDHMFRTVLGIVQQHSLAD